MDISPNSCCIICGKQMKFLMLSQDFFYKTTSKKFSIYKCNYCKLERIWPTPEQEEIDKSYPKEYYSFNMEENTFSRIKELAARYFYEEKGGLIYIRKLLALLFNLFFFSGLLLKHRGNNNFLDVGCGDGHDVKLMREYYWNAYGFELSQKKDEEKEGIFIKKSLEELDLGDMKFDYIRIWQVLEHVPNPDIFLNKIHQLLSKNGQIIIGIPNTSGLWPKIFGKFWFGKDVPRHLFNYDAENIKIILKNHQLMVKKIKYQSFNGLLGSIQNLTNGLMGSNIRIYNRTAGIILCYPFEFLCNLLKISDAIVITARRKGKN